MHHEELDPIILHEELSGKFVSTLNKRFSNNVGVSYSEWKLMLSIMLAHHEPTQERIASMAGKSPAAVSRQLNLLAERDLVERAVNKKSMRTNSILLTKEGKRIVNKGALVLGKISKELLTPIEGHVGDFKRLTIKLLKSLTED